MPRKRKPTVPKSPLKKYEHMRIRLVMIRDKDWKGPSKPFKGSKDAYDVLKYLSFEPVEVLYAALLDTKHQLIGLHEVARGGLRSTEPEVTALFQAAVMAQAAAVILAHNHPSGNPNPSPEDVVLTRNMKSACSLLGIAFLDHLIIGEDCYMSFADEDML